MLGDAQRIQAQLASQPTTVDLEHYRSVLRNKAVVDEAEKILRDFKPVTYDVSAHIKAIEDASPFNPGYPWDITVRLGTCGTQTGRADG